MVEVERSSTDFLVAGRRCPSLSSPKAAIIFFSEVFFYGQELSSSSASDDFSGGK